MKILKKILVFLLIFTISFECLFQHNQVETQAIAVVDDLGVIVLIGGTCVALSVLGYETFDSPKDALGTVFTEKQIDEIYDYFENENSLGGMFENLDTTLVSILRAIKEDNYMPVEQFTKTDGTSALKYIDRKGEFQVIDGGKNNLPPEIKDRCYFVPDIVKYIDSVKFIYELIDSGKTKVSNSSLVQLENFIKLAHKVVPGVGNVINDALKAYKANAEFLPGKYEYKNIDTSLIDQFKARYANTTYFVIQSTDFYNFIGAIPLYGILLRVRDHDSCYTALYSNYEQLQTALNNCKTQNDYSILKSMNGASTIKELEVPTGCQPNSYAYKYNNTTSVRLTFDNFDQKFTLDAYSYHFLLSQESTLTNHSGSRASYENDGLTGNIMSIDITDSTSDPAIYINGELSDIKVTEQFIESKKKLDVSGDIKINNDILQQISENNATTENIKTQIANTNDNIQQIDNTVSDGFKESNSLLGKIKDLITGIPGLLADIFNAIINLPGLIFDKFKSILNDILNQIKAIPAYLNNILEFIKTIPASIYNLFADILNKIWESIKALPGNIKEAFKDLLQDILDAIYVVSNAITDFENNLADKFKNLFVPTDIDLAEFNNDLKVNKVIDSIKELYYAFGNINDYLSQEPPKINIYLGHSPDETYKKFGDIEVLDFKNLEKNIYTYDITFIELLRIVTGFFLLFGFIKWYLYSIPLMLRGFTNMSFAYDRYNKKMKAGDKCDN